MYEIMVNYWPTVDTNPSSTDFEIEYAHIWKSIPKIVFSTTLTQVEGNMVLVRDDPVKMVTQLKEQPGKDLSIGGATIAATFIEHDLIDEYQIYINPVILGSGTPMFPLVNEKISLELVETCTFQSGVIFLRYQRSEGKM
jgi:dihydrofolate reductase